MLLLNPYADMILFCIPRSWKDLRVCFYIVQTSSLTNLPILMLQFGYVTLLGTCYLIPSRITFEVNGVVHWYLTQDMCYLQNG
jgi:hypothetical protein